MAVASPPPAAYASQPVPPAARVAPAVSAPAPGHADPAAEPAPGTQTWAPPPAPPQEPRAGASPVSQGAAVAALLLNILIWPGLGTLVAGDKKGWAQGFLTLGGLILTITIIGMIIGIPMMVAAWIWGVVSGVNLLNGKPA